jgi:exodeoxyribonuclease VII large subunit
VPPTTAPEGAEASACSIAELYDEIEQALAETFPKSRELWVLGEIQKITEAASGHAYLDVIDPEVKGDRNAPVLKAKCWKGTWGPLKARLRREGISLEAGMTIVAQGSVGFYKARAEIDFTIADINSDALLGRLARERQELIDALVGEGLYDAQRALLVEPVAVRIGLVGSPGTEGYHDFLGQLERSGISFAVSVVPTAVQGSKAAAEMAGAISALDTHGVDLICVVRGGGSKADLAPFDTPVIARAIATCATPVWTGIGHTGDESVADLVANQHHITPTACGVAVAERALSFWRGVVEAARLVASSSVELVRAEAGSHDELRSLLVSRAKSALREHERFLHHARGRLLVAPGSTLARASEAIHQRASRLAPAAAGRLATVAAELEGRRRLLGAYDPKRALERGWSLTLDDQGQIIRSVGDVSNGAMITTRMFDGELTSTVTDVRRGGQRS